ncbi:hypothetical protein HanHA300_Chr08g0292481 [Helianthus annuus]|nr:hypothetical protein HanHA300_Chr08g0292481 [Helianthus annuus]KAJ0554683.1 hypothetical protein HanHA89_Chr08g0310961 [Helianthus annuus]KAJ0720246.1 hypothetical protein HanLR1_Chr08g0291251 [Helianthus annuus]
MFSNEMLIGLISGHTNLYICSQLKRGLLEKRKPLFFKVSNRFIINMLLITWIQRYNYRTCNFCS